jgi:hypothetical protein
MLGFAESHTQVAVTLVVATLLQTRAPIGKNFGPLAGVLLSSPTTLNVIGVTVSVALAKTGASRASTIAPSRATVNLNKAKPLPYG